MFRFFKKKYEPDPDAPDWWQEYERETMGLDLKARVDQVKFSVLDVESTGLDVERDRILSFAMIPVLQEEMIPAGSFECLVQQEYFAEETIPIHELRREDIKEEITEKELWKIIVFLHIGTLIIEHNIGFDIAIINIALKINFRNLQLRNEVIVT